jgi:tetratricopeptide (TPR) repeat protein
MEQVTLKIILILSLLMGSGTKYPAGAQILGDSLALARLKKGMDHIYNCRFTQAGEVYEMLKREWPEHPVTSLYGGMLVYWEHFPLTPSSPAVGSFRNHMLSCMARCEKRRLLPGEAEVLLADIGARGMLLTYYSDNGLTSEVIPMASKTYQDVARAFDYTQTFGDFLFVTGLDNYYREAYPDAHPFYKPFALLFPRGDRRKGMAQLENAARNSIFLKAEATTFLCWINIGYEKNYEAAAHFSRQLLLSYPGNNEYRAMHVRNLLLLKRYDEAEEMLEKSSTPESLWFRMEKTVFRALLKEKKHRQSEEAEGLYLSAIEQCRPFGAFANEYLSYACFGMARMKALRGDKSQSQSYRKKALDLAPYKHVDFSD